MKSWYACVKSVATQARKGKISVSCGACRASSPCDRSKTRPCIAVAALGVARGRDGAVAGATVAARMCARSEVVELEVLGAEGGEARPAARRLRLSLLDLLGKLVRRDQPQPSHQPNRRKHNHRFRTFVSCVLELSVADQQAYKVLRRIYYDMHSVRGRRAKLPMKMLLLVKAGEQIDRVGRRGATALGPRAQNSVDDDDAVRFE
ncbi:hypothetical protein EVAR_78177_1 [Eumeta japonica]|uniref:Uncharacterized protein n=1 Tax=Eumeta variegata TaxID=151549 RepID=A0A4C1V005_EUMVA|nr:hypothetical protein EVAR_78177_1 [Eumeta japonica]